MKKSKSAINWYANCSPKGQTVQSYDAVLILFFVPGFHVYDMSSEVGPPTSEEPRGSGLLVSVNYGVLPLNFSASTVYTNSMLKSELSNQFMAFGKPVQNRVHKIWNFLLCNYEKLFWFVLHILSQASFSMLGNLASSVAAPVPEPNQDPQNPYVFGPPGSG
jgi:hypothetical protein